MTERKRVGAQKAYDPGCVRCPRLATFLRETRARYPDYWARPVPSFGDPAAPLVVVGLAPGMHGANRTARPFTGDHAGILLYQTLFDAGLSTQPVSTSAQDELRLTNARIVNAVKCVPPQNKPLRMQRPNALRPAHQIRCGNLSGKVLSARQAPASPVRSAPSLCAAYSAVCSEGKRAGFRIIKR